MKRLSVILISFILMMGISLPVLGLELRDPEFTEFEPPAPGERVPVVASVESDEEIEYWGEPETFGEHGADEVRALSIEGPGGTYTAFMSNEANGKWEIFLRLPSGEVKPVSPIDGQPAAHPNLDIDRDGNIYVVYYQYNLSDRCVETYCAKIPDYGYGETEHFAVSEIDGWNSGRWIGYGMGPLTLGSEQKYYRNDLADQGAPPCLYVERPAVACGNTGVHFAYTEQAVGDDGKWYGVYKRFDQYGETYCDIIAGGPWNAIYFVMDVNCEYVHIAWQDDRNLSHGYGWGVYYEYRYEEEGDVACNDYPVHEGPSFSCVTPSLSVDALGYVTVAFSSNQKNERFNEEGHHAIWACTIKGTSHFDRPYQISNVNWYSNDPYGEPAGIDYVACYYPEITGSGGTYPNRLIYYTWQGYLWGEKSSIRATVSHGQLKCAGRDMAISQSELINAFPTIALEDGYKPRVTWEAEQFNGQYDLAERSWLPCYVRCLGEVGGEPFDYFCFVGSDPSRSGFSFTIPPKGSGHFQFIGYNGVEQAETETIQIR